MNNLPKTYHFLALDGLRGIVAIFVVIWHTPHYWTNVKFGYTYLAVDIFFSLSGFVITHAYHEKLANGLPFLRFMKIRWNRLYPLYFLGLTLGIIAYFLGAFRLTTPLLSALLLSSLFLPNSLAVGQTLFAFNYPAWSLFYELLVNAFYGVMHRTLTIKRLVALLIGVAVVLFLMVNYKGTIDYGNMSGIKNMIIAGTRSFFGILTGVCICKLFHSKPKKVNGTTAIIAFSALILLLCIPPLKGFSTWVELCAVFFIIPLCIYLIACYEYRKPLTKYLKSAATFLGEISYPIYVIHLPIMQIGLCLFSDNISQYQNYSGVFLIMSLLGLSIFFSRTLDMPIRKYLNHKLLSR